MASGINALLTTTEKLKPDILILIDYKLNLVYTYVLILELMDIKWEVIM